MSSENRILRPIRTLIFSDLQTHGLSPRRKVAGRIALSFTPFLKRWSRTALSKLECRPFRACDVVACRALIANSAPPPGISPQLLLAAAGARSLPTSISSSDFIERTRIASVPPRWRASSAWLILRRRGTPCRAAAITAAYGSHLLLDWLGKDTSRPTRLTALWPFSSSYFLSGCDLFVEVSQLRLLDELFSAISRRSREMLVLTPVLLVAWVVWSGRTIVDRHRDPFPPPRHNDATPASDAAFLNGVGSVVSTGRRSPLSMSERDAPPLTFTRRDRRQAP